MPFVPTVGMEVIDGDWCVKVHEVLYCDGMVLAFVEKDKTNQHRSAEEMQRLEDEYLEDGWVKSNRLLSP